MGGETTTRPTVGTAGTSRKIKSARVQWRLRYPVSNPSSLRRTLFTPADPTEGLPSPQFEGDKVSLQLWGDMIWSISRTQTTSCVPVVCLR
jgi:hypothetical protein